MTNNRFKIGLDESSAIVSHYLHNKGSRFKVFKKKNFRDSWMGNRCKSTSNI